MIKRVVLLLLVVLSAACNKGFKPANYPQPENLFQASLKEYNKKHWEAAGKGFEHLTKELPTRDPLLPPSYYYLGKTQEKRDEHLLAAQSFQRLTEAFPEDTLADNALYESGLAYDRLWKRADLDAQYGNTALGVYRTLIALYPDSPLVPDAEKRIARLDEMFAVKDYNTGNYYLRRKAYDSAILYFKDVIRLHPNAPKTRQAYLRLLDAYREIKYTEDARELCDVMRKNYPADKEVLRACPQG